jgi:glycosyltransferase involved in cell wall biosynthesis
LKKIHLWFPDIFQFTGGIQVYSTFLLEALEELYPQIEYEVFLKHDNNLPADYDFSENINFHFAGDWPKQVRTYIFSAQLIKYAIYNRPNLIISTHINFSPIAYYLNRLLKIPYWIVVHGIDAWNISNPSLLGALSGAQRIFSVSEYTRERILQQHNISPEKISVLPNTVNTQKFHIGPKPQYLLQKYRLKPEQPVILTVSRLVGADRYKGYDQILQALPQISSVIADVHYILVGKGDDRLRLEGLIAQLKLENQVTLAGFIPDDELCSYYNLCDVFAMPSQAEGFGIVYLEALACGKPTLAGNQDGAVDALCQGELGVLVDPNNIQEIAETLIQILQGNHPHKLLYQGELLRAKLIAKYGFESFKQTLAKHLFQRFPAI